MMNLFLILILTFPINAQSSTSPEKYACSPKDRPQINKYFEISDEQESFIIDYLKMERKEILKKGGETLRPIVGGCEWSADGCPASLVKPDFPPLVRELKMSGSVKVEIIIDPEGRVIYAKPSGGPKLLRHFSSKAACRSAFFPKTIGGKTVFQTGAILYHFLL